MNSEKSAAHLELRLVHENSHLASNAQYCIQQAPLFDTWDYLAFAKGKARTVKAQRNESEKLEGALGTGWFPPGAFADADDADEDSGDEEGSDDKQDC